MPDIPLATSLPTTFTFQQTSTANQLDDSTNSQQQILPLNSQSQLNSVDQQQQQQQQQQRSSSSDDVSNANPTHPNDYETRLRCPKCDTWVVNLSDHLRKTHRIASSVDRKPLLRMARLEKRRMTESASNSSTTPPTTTNSAATTTTTVTRSPTNLIVNGLATNNEIENLLFKHEADPHQQFAVTLPENILLNHQLSHFASPSSSTTKRSRTSNEPLSPQKKPRISISDETKISPNSVKTTKKSKKNSQQGQTIIKTAASGIFPQQQTSDETSDDVSFDANLRFSKFPSFLVSDRQSFTNDGKRNEFSQPTFTNDIGSSSKTTRSRS